MFAGINAFTSAGGFGENDDELTPTMKSTSIPVDNNLNGVTAE